MSKQVRGLAELFRERGLLDKSAADTHGLFEWRTLADVFGSFPRRKFRQSAADPPWSEADCRGTNLFRRVRGGVRVGNFYSAKKIFCRIPPRRRSDPLGLSRTFSDSIGVRRGIVPPIILPHRRGLSPPTGGLNLPTGGFCPPREKSAKITRRTSSAADNVRQFFSAEKVRGRLFP